MCPILNAILCTVDECVFEQVPASVAVLNTGTLYYYPSNTSSKLFIGLNFKLFFKLW